MTDTGRGIRPEDQLRIFDPFYATKVTDGSGLGLATVYGIVQQCGGEIRVWSQKGEGSLFEIALPRTAPGAEPLPVAAPPDDVQGDGSPHVAADLSPSPHPVAGASPLVEAS